MLRISASLEETKGALKGRLVHCNHDAGGSRLGVGAWCFFWQVLRLILEKRVSPLPKKTRKSEGLLESRQNSTIQWIGEVELEGGAKTDAIGFGEHPRGTPQRKSVPGCRAKGRDV